MALQSTLLALTFLLRMLQAPALSSKARHAWPRPVYIRSMGAFLPNEPVQNKDIGKHLGEMGSKYSKKIQNQILNANGIKTRYYATINGRATHLGLDLAALAVQDALRNSQGVVLESVGMLATGSAMPDLLVPGFANLLHGKINATTSMDCLSSAGVCISSINALKAASHSVTLGEHQRALVVGTETMSHFLYASRFQTWADESSLDIRQQFNAEFLRYMLSDGSGCALIDTEPHPSKLSYRIEGFYHHSFAHENNPCMVVGVDAPGQPVQVGQTWKTRHSATLAGDAEHAFKPLVVVQDVKFLNSNIVKLHEEGLKAARDAGLLENIDWFFPHLSSHIFYDDLADQAERIAGVSRDRIWTNLAWVGNVGSASAFLLLWGALNDDTNKPPVKVGDRILVSVPESGQFSFHFVLVTVVDHHGVQKLNLGLVVEESAEETTRGLAHLTHEGLLRKDFMKRRVQAVVSEQDCHSFNDKTLRRISLKYSRASVPEAVATAEQEAYEAQEYLASARAELQAAAATVGEGEDITASVGPRLSLCTLRRSLARLSCTLSPLRSNSTSKIILEEETPEQLFVPVIQFPSGVWG